MKKRKQKVKGGFSYHPTREQIEEYKKWPAEWKLAWLSNAAQFLQEALPPKGKVIMEKYRKGEDPS